MRCESPDSGKEKCVHIHRIREFYTHESPTLLKIVEEITIFTCKENIKEITYDVGFIRNDLKIFDAGGRPLEFHGFNETVDTEIPRVRGKDTSKTDIIISFRDDSFPGPDKYYTFRLEYRKLFNNNPKDSFLIERPIENYKLYITIRSLESFKLDIYSVIKHKLPLSLPKQEDPLYRLDEFIEYGIIVETVNEIYYSLIIRPNSVPDYNICIVFSYIFFRNDKFWFITGIVLGIICTIFLLINILMQCIIDISVTLAVVTIVNTYLILTKGWIFTKDMDKISGVVSPRFSYTISYNIFIITNFLLLLLVIWLKYFALTNITIM